MNDLKETTWIETYFDYIKDRFSNGEYDDFMKYLFPTYTWNKKFPYIFCLSEVKDSLSQWRAYATDGKGISFGFDFDKIGLKRDLPSPNVYRDNTIGIQKVENSKSRQKKIIKDLTESFKEMYDKKEDELWEVSSTFLALQLARYSLVFKNPSFAEEKEWRIIHTPLDEKSHYEDIEKNKIDISDIKFRTLGSRMTTYTILNLQKKFDSSLIPEIVLGPKAEVDIGILDLFLKSNNLKKTTIIKSESTYR